MNRYCVSIAWDYTCEESFEECSIFKAEPEYEDYDGSNMVSGGGRDGYSFDIYNSLEEAIINAHFNPEYIKFVDLSIEELNEKNKILSKYVWDKVKGLVKK